MLNYIFGKPTRGQELKTLVSQLTSANEKMTQRAKSAQKVGESLHALIASEAPSFLRFFERIRDIYAKLGENYETAASEQARAIEDLNDIVVRYPILQRIESERAALKKRYEAVSQRYKEAKGKQQTQESAAALRNCRVERAAAATALIEKTEEYLNYRHRFNRFVHNRSKSAWARYGASIERTAMVEVELMTALSELCKRLRDSVDAPKQVVAAVEAAAARPVGEIELSDGEMEAPDTEYSQDEQNEEEDVGPPRDLTEADFRD